jgi:hypothetical protein
MPVRCGRQVVLLCVIVGLVTSCGHHEKKPGTSYTGYVPPGMAPTALSDISDRAVDIIDMADMEDWPQVYASVQEISDAWSDYKHPTVVPPSSPRGATALLYGRLDTALARLKDAAAARDSDQTMRAANDVDAAAVELIEYYNPTIPPELQRLAVLERKIMLDAWDGRIESADQTLVEVRRTWTQVRPVVVERSSDEAAETFDDRITDQQRAIDAQESSTLGNYAEDALIMLKEMEQLSY